MKKIICTLLFCLSLISGFAQVPPIMVCNSSGTSCTPYNNLDTAIVAAAAGSYIYIPGRIIPINVHLNKELHIIGGGHYLDSSFVTGISEITGNLYLDNGSDNCTIEGIYFSNTIINNGSSSLTIYNIQITRCSFPGITCPYLGYFNNCLIKDCIVRSDYLYANFIYSTISNCYLRYGIIYANNSIVSNCIFEIASLSPSTGGVGLSNLNVKNNIFASTEDMCGGTCFHCDGCIVNNNITVNGSLSLVGVSIETGTISNVPDSNLFVNVTSTDFNYSYDYHLKSTSPGHNFGDDGTDVGIYGGVPYKSGAVPSNPHFFYKNISATTDSTGNLPVHFKVRGEY